VPTSCLFPLFCVATWFSTLKNFRTSVSDVEPGLCLPSPPDPEVPFPLSSGFSSDLDVTGYNRRSLLRRSRFRARDSLQRASPCPPPALLFSTLPYWTLSEIFNVLDGPFHLCHSPLELFRGLVASQFCIFLRWLVSLITPPPPHLPPLQRSSFQMGYAWRFLRVVFCCPAWFL